jgi:hypothetical protein
MIGRPNIDSCVIFSGTSAGQLRPTSGSPQRPRGPAIRWSSYREWGATEARSNRPASARLSPAGTTARLFLNVHRRPASPGRPQRAMRRSWARERTPPSERVIRPQTSAVSFREERRRSAGPGRSFGLNLRSDGSLTAGYSGSSSSRPNGPSSRSMDEKSGGRSDGSSSPST